MVDWHSAIRPELALLAPYVPGMRESELRDRAGVHRIVKLSSNEHPDGPFPSALRAMEEAVRNANRYPDAAARVLSAQIAVRHGVSEDQVVIGNGSNEIVRLIGQVLLRPGDEVVFAWPSFVVYPTIARMFGAAPVFVPLTDDETHDLEAIARACSTRTRLVFLCNPNNPTGTIYSRRSFEEFLARVPDDVVLVIDEAYREFVDDDSFPDGMEYLSTSSARVVTRTFSKMHSLAGVRVGYAIAPAPLVSAIHRVREPFNVSNVAQAGALASLNDGAEVARRFAENRQLRSRVYAAFDRLGVAYVRSQANFVYVPTARPAEVFNALLGEGVIVRELGDTRALRVTIGTAEEMEIMLSAFETVLHRQDGWS